MQLAPLTNAEFNRFAKLVDAHTGILMPEKKKRMLSNRLKDRIKKLKLSSYKEYYDLLSKDKRGTGEVLNFIDTVTTNETYFFRAEKIWKFFTQKFLPNWYENNQNDVLHMWCGAASSGEEPYTIAILCSEFAEHHPGFKWNLCCSDISELMLEKCKAGRYKGRAIHKVPKFLLAKYFVETEEFYEVNKDLRRKLRFFKHNLHDPPMERRKDLIFLRNVLIYFDIPTKGKILAHMDNAMKATGTLIIGESEGLVNTDSVFKYVTHSVFVKET